MMIKEEMNMSKLNSALELAALGFHVFPLLENSKKPLIKDFPNKASRDPEAIRAWWTDPVLEMERGYNIGISTSKFGEGESLIAIDVDNKGDKKGDEVLDEMDILGIEVPATFTQTTPTGGRHLIYRHSEALKQGVDVLGRGLDIRSKGGYLVGAGSELNGLKYTYAQSDISFVPAWLASKLGKARDKDDSINVNKILDQVTAIDRATYYLSNEAPESVKGEGGDQTAYKVAAKVKDFGVDEATCLEIMLDHWFDGSGWIPEKLQAKISHAYKYGTESVGAEAPEAVFSPVKKEDDEVSHYLKEINKSHALVLLEGNYFVIQETIDEKGMPKRNFLNEAAFKRKFSPNKLQKSDTFATQWLDWQGRREYQGICFAPEREARNNYYNLWRGFSYTPLSYEDANSEQRKGFDMFMSHVKENVCRGNSDLTVWLMGYFAHLIQKPYERPLTTVVFRGSKGVGKNAPIDRIGKLIQGHYMVAHNKRYLTSNFNGHMDSCLCLVLDEAFWSGDKDSEGQLKGLTTAPEILIERKGKEPYSVDNLVRLIIIGNEDWLVPASTDERRYAVLDVGEGKKQNNAFFEEMRIRMDDKGGNKILLDFLKKFDLSAVDVNRAPQTQALLEQKISSLDPFASWWYECLNQGQVINAEFSGEWPLSIDTHVFRSAFARYCKDRNIHSRIPTPTVIGKAFKKMVTAPTSKRRENENTIWIYKLPLLEDARKEWEKYIGHETTWED